MPYLTDTNLITTSQEPSTLERSTWCLMSAAVCAATGSCAGLGAMLGWVAAGGSASLNPPCIEAPNDGARELCGYTSPSARLGAAIGAGVGAGLGCSGAIAALFFAHNKEEAAAKILCYSACWPVAACLGK